ncbi:MAG: methyltransferase domain-containing protein [Hyphomicrobium sp.]
MTSKDWCHPSTEVANHYDTTHVREASRLDQESPIELAITTRHLNAGVRPGSVVLDVGVGAGHYAEFLATRECQLILVDISARMLELTVLRLRRAGLDGRILDVHLCSATNLQSIADGCCDAVLLLGPLYHLCRKDDRYAAAAEAFRVLKGNGTLFAAGINRLAYFRDLCRDEPTAIASRLEFHSRFLADGNLAPAQAPKIGYAHLTTVDEFRALFPRHFQENALVGIESFATSHQGQIAQLDETLREAWLDLVEQTGGTPEGLAGANHFLYIGRKLTAGIGAPGSSPRFDR